MQPPGIIIISQFGSGLSKYAHGKITNGNSLEMTESNSTKVSLELTQEKKYFTLISNWLLEMLIGHLSLQKHYKLVDWYLCDLLRIIYEKK